MKLPLPARKAKPQAEAATPDKAAAKDKPKATKAQAVPQHRRGEGGRALWVYFLPTVLVSVLVLVLLGVQTLFAMRTAQQDAGRLGARTSVEALAGQLAAEVSARRQQLLMIAALPQAEDALRLGASARQPSVQQLQGLLSEALQLRVFAHGETVEPDTGGEAPMGYAGVDLVNEALRGRQSLAEIHQLTGKPYMAMAVPLLRGEQVQGALFAAWPLKVVTRATALAAEFPGDWQLLQGSGGAYVLAGSVSGRELDSLEGQVNVDGSIWRIGYTLNPVSLGSDSTMIVSLLGGGLLALLLGILLQYRMLGADFRKDMATLVNLGEAILSGEGASERAPRLAASRDAILLLIDFARKRHSRSALKSEAPKMQVSEPARPVSTPDISMQHQIDVPEAIFRAYDVRGVVDRDIDGDLAYLLGQAFGEKAASEGVKQVSIAYDARPSSPKLYDAFSEGLVDQGLHVVELGLAPVALPYYAMHTSEHTAAVMVTGSHNPPEYNGFKLYLGARPLHGDALMGLRERMLKGGFESRQGHRGKRDLASTYIEAVSAEVSVQRPLTVVVDGGNGVAGELACALLEQIGCEVVPLFCEPDGSFPNHHPDPGNPDNLAALGLEVQAREAHLGIAFDGDGDRVALVDNEGQPARPEHLLMLLAADILLRHPGTDVIYDVKSSRHLAAFVLANGGRPIMSRAGHTRMKEKMRETGALVGGEFSGHFFIKERWFGSDDAIYVAARLLEVIASDPRTLSQVLADLPSSPSTPELQLLLEEGEAAALMRAIEGVSGNFEGAKLIDMDGLRVEFQEGWGLVRPSNTVPSLVFRFEADSEPALAHIQQKFREVMQQVLPDRQLPF